MNTLSVFSLKTLELVWRFFTAIYMFKYGYVKFGGHQFAYGKQLYDKTLNEISGFDLMWVFFSYSDTLTAIIGCLQILGGFLLLFNKTKLIGVVILFPILLNILLIDYFYGLPGILQALVNVVFYLLVLLLICYNERTRIASAFNQLIITSNLSNFDFKKASFQAIIIAIGSVITYLIINEVIKKAILGIQYKSDYFN
ncbi:uncharacterized protein UJ101_01890 [Flavobacteriaceae bacterium UJ101]|nr:uncharacterized protein UJ101_01890 [Flavobacteriaceae bacterium UJ101]